MKIAITAILLISLFSCKKDDVIPQKSLIGSRWSSFSYKSVLDNSNVYKILYFKNETEVEYYFATEKTRVNGAKEILTYTYAHPKLIVSRVNTVNNNKPFTSEGTVNDGFLTVMSNDYTKE